eukprot:CAMPEP_0184044908 /NCGR_PEP_ID=MMETSP0956-20121227/574_1 /TAXON_ID=627963 /ORGANISM="Aplanochytrium sp, Strain PBS07" /LENGTH=301 /DNA_ID=CAMNT_0026336057 /DNA_START=116 /DNA_END=1022 /DNA_ORIENTATION=-
MSYNYNYGYSHNAGNGGGPPYGQPQQPQHPPPQQPSYENDEDLEAFFTDEYSGNPYAAGEDPLDAFYTEDYAANVSGAVEEMMEYYYTNGLEKTKIMLKIRFGAPLRPSEEPQEEEALPQQQLPPSKRATKFGQQIIPTDVSKEIDFLRKTSRNEGGGVGFLRHAQPWDSNRKKSSQIVSPTLDRKLNRIRNREERNYRNEVVEEEEDRKKSTLMRKLDQRRRASENPGLPNKKNPALKQLSEPQLDNTLARKFNRIRHTEEERNRPAEEPVEEGPCKKYQLDMAGSSFGVCVCGFPKSAH